MLTKETNLPTYEELTVPEVELSTPFLRASAFHLGKQCEAENNVSQFTFVFRKSHLNFQKRKL